MLTKETLYCLDDVIVIPAPISLISSRKECNARLEDGNLPLFTSPMPCVVNRETLENYHNAGINTIIPRGNGDKDELKLRYEESKTQWVAFSLDEFRNLFIDHASEEKNEHHVLIDMANGHMQKLGYAIKSAKTINPNLVIMAGNCARCETYAWLSKMGADYVRISIGTGSVCNTTTFTSVGYGMASLIDECARIKEGMSLESKIIADGGCNKIRDIIKCLALGADYVMLGGMLNACSDSAGDVEWVEESQENMKLYYGMASKRGAAALGKTTDYPEGKVKYNKIKGTIKQFADNLENYLKSTMSYCNSKYLETFKDLAECRILSPTAQKAFNQN